MSAEKIFALKTNRREKMKLKYLLACSAAAITTTNAFAADAVVVQPEPVESVRVCDAYGSGFFFIPGTETCIRFGGYVRSSYELLQVDGELGGVLGGATEDTPDAVNSDATFTNWANRGRLNLDIRNETDFGTLRALYRLEGGSSNVDVDIDLDVALISLAGFRAGFAGANYWSTNHGFGAVNAESLAFNAQGVVYEDGFYGFDDGTIFDYTFSQDGLALTVGVEDNRISYGRDNFNNDTNNGSVADANEVNFYAGLNYSADFGTLAFTAAYDSLATEINSAGITTDVGGWAYKASFNFDLSDFAPGAFISGYYLNDGDFNTDYLHTALLTENPEEIFGIAGQVNLSDEVELWANYWVAVGGDAITGGSPGENLGDVAVGNVIEEGDVDQFSIGLNWFPKAAPGFQIKASYTHGQVENSASSLVNGTAASQVNGTSFDFDAFIVSLRRDF